MQVYDAERCEWGNELVRVVPFIYNQFITGKDVSIHTTKGMRYFYFFLNDDRVIIKYPHRYQLRGVLSEGIPKQNLYDDELNYDKWTPPPYKIYFEGLPIKFPKTKFSDKRKTIIVSNKHNKEWMWTGLNTIPLQILDEMFQYLVPKFNVIYNRLKPEFFVGDDDTLSHEEFNDSALLEKYPSVIDINELYLDNSPMDIGDFQLRVFSKADRFINVQGGLGHFASYFGGKQLFFLERNGHKHIEHSRLKHLQGWHTRLGGADVLTASKEDVLSKLEFLTN